MQRLCRHHLALVSSCPPQQDVNDKYVPEVPAFITCQCLELAMIGYLPSTGLEVTAWNAYHGTWQSQRLFAVPKLCHCRQRLPGSGRQPPDACAGHELSPQVLGSIRL